MSNRYIILIATWMALMVAAISVVANTNAAERPPNIVLFFVDNLGNGDIGCFGSKLHRTPHIDRLAREGTKFTSFYVASGVCTPSRAALMTGCYPQRVSMHVSGVGGAVLGPARYEGAESQRDDDRGSPQKCRLLDRDFRQVAPGRSAGVFANAARLRLFFGIPYSDDQTKDKRPETWPELPLMRNEKAIEAPVDRDYLVKRCTEEAISFIEQNRGRPWFAYIPHTMPGSTPHPFSSPAFAAKAPMVTTAMRWRSLIGPREQILATLERLQLAENTLVIWTSDNGAVLRNPPQGSCAPYRGSGYDTSEGAMRMPCVMRFPGRIPAGRVCDEIVSTMDLLPTFAQLAGAALPSRPIDGHDARALLFGDVTAKSSWDEEGLMFYRMEQLQAVRSGPWKLYLPLAEKYVANSRRVAAVPAALFDVRNDVGETQEVSTNHPDVVQRLTKLADTTRQELGDVNKPGRGQRPAGHVANPQPLVP